MYKKDLKEDLRLRLTTVDMDFLRKISEERGVTVSESIRAIIGEYRRSLETVDILKKAIALTDDLKKQEEGKEGKLFNGNTKPDKHDKL